jgi:hypothetical protein
VQKFHSQRLLYIISEYIYALRLAPFFCFTRRQTAHNICIYITSIFDSYRYIKHVNCTTEEKEWNTLCECVRVSVCMYVCVFLFACMHECVRTTNEHFTVYMPCLRYIFFSFFLVFKCNVQGHQYINIFYLYLSQDVLFFSWYTKLLISDMT